ncbi:hypothetical protein [Egbenema bharatensis]|uniref:hypothetical protein n=1 Tax=Egbenema bharatensis TaxID=3463334 RepID=UPI003A857971
MSNSENLESRVESVEVDMRELKQIVRETARNVSDLRSDLATLADIVNANHEEAQAERAEARADREVIKERMDRFEAQANADRALMLELIQRLGQGGNGSSGN